MRRLFLFALALGGCRVETDFDGTRYQCRMGVACPAGSTCIDGFCERADAAPPGPCGQMDRLFADDFEGAFDATLWDAGGGWSQSGGRLELQTFADSPGNYSVVRSHHAYDLRGSRMSVEVEQMVDVATEAEAHFEAVHRDTEQASLGFFQRSGLLHAYHTLDRIYTEDFVMPYSPGDHRFWQLREEDGMIYFETAPDGAAWVAHDATPTPAYARWAVFHLGAGTAASIPTSGGPAIFDDANGGAAAGGRSCRIDDLADAFEDAAFGDAWQTYPDAGCALGASGALQVGTPGTFLCGLHSRAAYDLRGASFLVEVAQAAGGVETYVGLEAAGGAVAVRVIGTTLDLGGPTLPYDPAQHRWWRIREEAGSIVIETSPDGRGFTERRRRPADVPLDALRIVLATRSSGVASSAPARFDNVNLPP